MTTPAFTLELHVGPPPPQAWALLWDLDRHTRHVPLTTVGPGAGAPAGSSPGAPLGPGAEFTATTRLGPVRIDDRMVVTRWEPPHLAVIEKVGRPLGGQIEAALEPHGAGTLLRWHQSVSVGRIPAPLVRLALPAVREGYRQALRRIVARP
ncbi:SRPBCC family protein [Ornithinimicrobium panacihumi]|uniref:SRPBCC family protein n=1 Tax=Ornithinimicrobium panacihumi TaxID=2008449 RepID=UPI003F89A415